MKTMCPPGYHQNGFVATHALGHIYTTLVLLLLIFEHSVCHGSLMTTYIHVYHFICLFYL